MATVPAAIQPLLDETFFCHLQSALHCLRRQNSAVRTMVCLISCPGVRLRAAQTVEIKLQSVGRDHRGRNFPRRSSIALRALAYLLLVVLEYSLLQHQHTLSVSQMYPTHTPWLAQSLTYHVVYASRVDQVLLLPWNVLHANFSLCVSNSKTLRTVCTASYPRDHVVNIGSWKNPKGVFVTPSIKWRN